MKFTVKGLFEITKFRAPPSRCPCHVTSCLLGVTILEKKKALKEVLLDGFVIGHHSPELQHIFRFNHVTQIHITQLDPYDPEGLLYNDSGSVYAVFSSMRVER